MPPVKITNKTSHTLNVSLSVLVPVHFHNELLPDQTCEFHVGSVWFTFECRKDKITNRYSLSQSAKTIALVSLTGASIAVVAIPLTITGLAPLVGSSSTLLASLAGKQLIATAATPQVLTLTTWIATHLTKTTIHQLAIEEGMSEEELERTLQASTTLVDGVRYLCLSTTALHAVPKAGAVAPNAGAVAPKAGAVAPKAGAVLESTNSPPAASTSKKNKGVATNPLVGVATHRALDYLTNMLKKNPAKRKGTSSQTPTDEFDAMDGDWELLEGLSSENEFALEAVSVRGVSIGFQESYHFEWRDRAGPSVSQTDPKAVSSGPQLWDVKSNLPLN